MYSNRQPMLFRQGNYIPSMGTQGKSKSSLHHVVFFYMILLIMRVVSIDLNSSF